MRRKRKEQKKRIILLAVLLLLCVLAVTYIVKLEGRRAEEARAAQAAEEAAAAQQEAEEAAAAEEAEASEKSDHIYAYSGSSEDAKFSMAAYDSAVEAGAGVLVLPFVVSQDGTLYVADDDYAENLTGYGGYFSGMTDGQIDNLETKSGGRMLKLSEVFDKYGRDVHYVIELKYTSERNLLALKDVIDKNDYADVVSISSEYFSGLRSMDNELPNVPKIFLCSNEENWGEALNLDYLDAISVSSEMMSEERCKAAHEKDKKFGAGILKSEGDIKSAIDMGADFYFTEESALASGLEKQ